MLIVVFITLAWNHKLTNETYFWALLLNYTVGLHPCEPCASKVSHTNILDWPSRFQITSMRFIFMSVICFKAIHISKMFLQEILPQLKRMSLMTHISLSVKWKLLSLSCWIMVKLITSMCLEMSPWRRKGAVTSFKCPTIVDSLGQSFIANLSYAFKISCVYRS